MQQHFSAIDEAERKLKAKIEAQFKDTPYSLEINRTALNETLPEGTVKAEDLLALKFGYLVWVTGAESKEKREIVKSKLMSAVTYEEWKTMRIIFHTGTKDGVNQFYGDGPLSD